VADAEVTRELLLLALAPVDVHDVDAGQVVDLAAQLVSDLTWPD
jgi:hypothetical protein